MSRPRSREAAIEGQKVERATIRANDGKALVGEQKSMVVNEITPAEQRRMFEKVKPVYDRNAATIGAGPSPSSLTHRRRRVAADDCPIVQRAAQETFGWRAREQPKSGGVARSIGDDARDHAKQRCGLTPGLVLGYRPASRAGSGVMLVPAKLPSR